MKILLIGGSGNISWNCANEWTAQGHEVWVLNRRCTLKTRKSLDELPVQIIKADYRQMESVREILSSYKFDVVCDFICYNKEQAYFDVNFFKGKVKQFLFISSAANYDRRQITYPITEESKVGADFWEYAKNKIECEQVFLEAYEKEGFPVTIIRPGHTYDTLVPEAVGNGDWTNALRMTQHKSIIVHGDGTNLWTITHASDVAKALLGVLLNEQALGQCYHITNDEVLTWNEITEIVAKCLKISDLQVVNIPSHKIMEMDYNLGSGIVGHKMWTDIYDNTKIKNLVNGWEAKIDAERGIYETIKWLKEDSNRQRVNADLDRLIDRMCEKYR